MTTSHQTVGSPEPRDERAELIDEIVAEARRLPEAALGVLRRNGLVIDKWPPPDRPSGRWTPEAIAALDPEVRWQGVAFTFYTDLVAGPLQSRLRELDEFDELAAAVGSPGTGVESDA